MFGIIWTIGVFLAAAGFCLVTLNKLPRDISAIATAIRERNRDEIWASLGVALFFWGVTAILAWKVVVPWTGKSFSVGKVISSSSRDSEVVPAHKGILSNVSVLPALYCLSEKPR